jgi:hypothetical protein
MSGVKASGYSGARMLPIGTVRLRVAPARSHALVK